MELMLTHFATKRLRRLAAFLADRRGNIVVTFTLALLPIMGAIGAAVDYSHANSIKSAMQAAIDATALMASKSAATQTNSQLQTAATNYFTALFTRPEAKNVQITVDYTTTGGSQLTANASAVMTTDFMGIMGYKTLNISASSTVAWGNSRLRVALALDNTGSMSSAGKMTALKTAAKNLLVQLQNAATKNGDVYVSIIPFSKDVNVDKVNYQQAWVRWDLWDVANGTCSDNDYSTKSSCQSHNKTWTPRNHNTWNGCVTDRDQDYDTKNTAPSTTLQPTLFPAEQYSSCPESMMGLSYDWTALKNKVDAMTPVGNTNQAIGLQWAYQSLTSSPFTIPPIDANYKYQQIIILLTDGLNTQNRWSTSQSTIDARQTITCNNVKAAGIIMYTVQVNTDGDPTQQMLKSCASSADKFFLLTSANAIVSTFNQIGTALSNLRVAK